MVRPNWVIILAMVVASAALSNVGAGPSAAAPRAPRQDAAFDAVSLKPSPADAGHMRVAFDPGRLTMTHVTLRAMILDAYGLDDYQLKGGPSWMANERYDLEATSAQPLDAKAEVRLLQPILGSRFGLVITHAPEQLPIYRLLPAKNGLQLDGNRTGMKLFKMPAQANGEKLGIVDFQVSFYRNGDDGTEGKAALSRMVQAEGATAADLATELGRVLGRRVIDATGDTAKHDFALRFANDNNDADANVPALPTALREQLGLELQAGKGPVEIYTVQAAEHPGAEH